MTGHSGFVNSVCIINPTDQYPNGLILTGGGDNRICVYNFGEAEPIQKFKAHDSIVCSLKTSIVDVNRFFSSSWIGTAKLWDLNNLKKPIRIYIGHGTAVWCVNELPNGSIVTGSANGSAINLCIITVYSRQGEVLHKLRGHSGVVRDITVINDNEFLTCGNDGRIICWNALTGERLKNYCAHSESVYSISAMPEGHLMTSSGEDKTVRVWKDGEVAQTIDFPVRSIWSVKFLPNEDIVCGGSDGAVRIFTADPKRYADAETMQKFDNAVANFQEDPEEKLCPNVQVRTALLQPGKIDGESMLVYDGDVKFYNWSQSESRWILKEVIKKFNSTSETLDNEIQYDYCFIQRLCRVAPTWKIFYNYGQDPWLAVKKFLTDNFLPLLPSLFLDMFANYIISRIALRGNRCISVKKYQKLKEGSLDSIIGDLKDFNCKQEIECLAEDQIDLVAKLTTDAYQEAIAAGGIGYLMSLLNWPNEFVFPVLDIVHLAISQEKVNEQLCKDELLRLIKPHLTQKQSVNQVLTFRILTNMFYYETGERLALSCKEDALSAIQVLDSPGDENHQIAVSTYVLNLSVALSKMNDVEAARPMFNAIKHLFDIFDETEAIFRIISALGTLMIDHRELIKLAKASATMLDHLKTFSVSPDQILNKVSIAAREIMFLINGHFENI